MEGIISPKVKNTTLKRQLKGNIQPFSKKVILDAQEIGLYAYFIPITGKQGHIVNIMGKEHVMLGSNNYLGMTEHPEVITAAKKAIDKYGVGCTGSRFLNGTLDIHIEMEELLSSFMGTESSLIFSTGYQTNVGAIYSLAGKEDTILSDQYNHASIVDGSRMSRAEVIVYEHNDARSMENCLSQVPEERGILAITDGIFSMEGDILKLPEVDKVCKRNDIFLMLDDAHSIGVLGEKGRGTASHFGIDVDMTMGTFSKSLASLGGFISADEDVIFNIKHRARTLMFSAAPSPSNIATAKKSLELLMDEPHHRNNLWNNARYLKKGLEDLGFDTGKSESPIIPVIIGEDIIATAYWRQLLDMGIYTNPVLYPATARDRNLIRNSVMATHTKDDLNRVLDAYEKVLDMIPLDDI